MAEIGSVIDPRADPRRNRLTENRLTVLGETVAMKKRGWRTARRIVLSIIFGIVQVLIVFYVLKGIKDSNTRLIVAVLGLIYVAIVSGFENIALGVLELRGVMLELKQRLGDDKAELELQEHNQSLSISNQSTESFSW